MVESRVVKLYHNSNTKSDPDIKYLDSVDNTDSSEHATATAYANNPDSRWAIDSRATRHFTSYLKDFDSGSVKR